MVGWVLPVRLTAWLAWKCPQVPGNPIQMFSPTGCLSSRGAKEQGWEAEPALSIVKEISLISQPKVPVSHPTTANATPRTWLLADCSFCYVVAASGSMLSLSQTFITPRRDRYIKLLPFKRTQQHWVSILGTSGSTLCPRNENPYCGETLL